MLAAVINSAITYLSDMRAIIPTPKGFKSLMTTARRDQKDQYEAGAPASGAKATASAVVPVAA